MNAKNKPHTVIVRPVVCTKALSKLSELNLQEKTERLLFIPFHHGMRLKCQGFFGERKQIID